MMEVRRKARGALGPGILLLVLATTCLVCGFFGGRYHGASGSGGSSSSNNSNRKHVKQVATQPVCLDTCHKANDGVCDDGRATVTVIDTLLKRTSSAKAVCDLGTDCKDCGPWAPTVLPEWVTTQGTVGPIGLLQKKQVEVRVKPSSVSLPDGTTFKFAYTDPKKDYDVSAHMEEAGHVEMSITKVFYNILKDRCVRPDGSRALFVDVGANFGWFTVFSAIMGCRVVAFEPVPHFKAFLEYNVDINNLGHLVDIRGVVISNVGDKNLNMVVPSAGIWGTAGIDGLNIDSSVPGSTETLSIPSFTLDSSIKEDVLLMKVDVEGWEWSVMAGAQDLLSRHNVENIVMEYSPGVPERNFQFNESIATVKMLMDMIQQGYRIAHLQERTGSGIGETVVDPLPRYEEVLMQNLKYDLQDILLLKVNKLGCPLPSEIRLCGGSVPEDLSPRSLRSLFSHNTNLWASKHPTLQPLQGHVGFVKLHEPPETYMITHQVNNESMGMGFRRCSDMEPQWQVRHRCACTNKAVCGPEEDLVLRLAKEGKIPTNYILPPTSRARRQ